MSIAHSIDLQDKWAFSRPPIGHCGLAVAAGRRYQKAKSVLGSRYSTLSQHHSIRGKLQMKMCKIDKVTNSPIKDKEIMFFVQ